MKVTRTTERYEDGQLIERIIEVHETPDPVAPTPVVITSSPNYVPLPTSTPWQPSIPEITWGVPEMAPTITCANREEIAVDGKLRVQYHQ